MTVILAFMCDFHDYFFLAIFNEPQLPSNIIVTNDREQNLGTQDLSFIRKGERIEATLSLVFYSFSIKQITTLNTYNNHHFLKVYWYLIQIFKHFNMLMKETSNKLCMEAYR